jgi:hypothetical protein
MSSPKQIAHLDKATRTIDHVIDAVVERGCDEKSESTDDYGALLASFEHRKLVTFQLYDSYFPPKRHEFELHLLSSLVDAVASNPAAAFLGGAAAGGVVGNAAYDVLKHLLARLISKSKPIKRTHNGFKDIEKNTDRITLFFKKRRQASVSDICKVLDTEPGKIEPLLKLLGFRCRRVGTRRIWLAPVSQKASRIKKPK